MESENEAEGEAAPEVEEAAEALGGEEEEASAAPAEPAASVAAAVLPTGAVPVKARIICSARPDDEPITLGKALVPGGSPLRMDVPGAGTLLLTAILKSPPPSLKSPPPSELLVGEQQAEAAPVSPVPSPSAPPAPAASGDVKCLCRSARRGGNEDQIRALATTLEQISSMQKLLSDLQQRAQSLSEQLVATRQQPPPPPQPVMGFGGLPQTPPTQTPPYFSGRGPPGGQEVFSAPGLGIYVVQKDAAGGPRPDTQGMYMPYEPQPAIDMQPWAGNDTTKRDWRPQKQADVPQNRGGLGAVCCGGGGAVSCGGGGAVSCGGGGIPACCGGGGAPACCGGGGIPTCCGRVPTHSCCGRPVACCAAAGGGGGGGGGGGHTCCAGQTGQAAAPYQQQAVPEQEGISCQGDCGMACDSPSTCGRYAR